MQHIGIVVKTRAPEGLGGGVVALFKGVYKNVDERVDHEHAQKRDSRQQVQPGFPVLFLHVCLPSERGKGDALTRPGIKQIRLEGLEAKAHTARFYMR